MCRKYDGMYVNEALLFITSRRAVCNIEDICKVKSEQCKSYGILCKDVLTDRSSGKSSDRKQISKLMEMLESGDYSVLVVSDIHELTNNQADLEELMNDIALLGVGIFDMSVMQYRHNNYDEGC